MSEPKVAPSGKVPDEDGGAAEPVLDEARETLELREERLVAQKQTRELGAIELHTEVESVPGRLEVDAVREEVVVEHEPVGEVVAERLPPWEEDGVFVVPIYEERLVVSKRLVLRERIRIRRASSTERQLFEETLRRERLVVTDPQQTGRVREVYSTEDEQAEEQSNASPGFFEGLVRKALE
ncbi:MAG: DUF2382 domain-containing protein [Chloroflexi bacterium]|nr:DUF2382 domain-containing protein [Chloroflexota bacterium]